jgi:hypothetical protein
MTDVELIDALFAHDNGATDSGIKDDAAKAALFERFHAEADATGRDPEVLIDYVASFVSAEGKKQGYGLEDVSSFFRWLGDNGYDV